MIPPIFQFQGYGTSEINTITNEFKPRFSETTSASPWNCLAKDQAYWKIVSERCFCAGGDGMSVPRTGGNLESFLHGSNVGLC